MEVVDVIATKPTGLFKSLDDVPLEDIRIIEASQIR
jgi:hypothetical protein